MCRSRCIILEAHGSVIASIQFISPEYGKRGGNGRAKAPSGRSSANRKLEMSTRIPSRI
jgi:hypothetical protein